MKKRFFFIIIVGLVISSFSADKPAYQLFSAKGKKVDYDEMIKQLKKADIVFFGELHDNPISHWLEIEVTKSLYDEKKENLVLGAEMFETDNQICLNEYVNSWFSDSKFEEDARIWKNYKTDYKPLVKFARDKKLNFIATNIPRRYASVVFSKGFEALDSLSSEAKMFIAPLPIKYDTLVECYASLLKDNPSMGSQHSNKNLPKAQAIKDATMAHFIMKNWKNEKLFLHFNGSYHSDNHEGIIWYINQLNKDLKILTISTVQQSQLDSLEKDSKNVADYIICIDDDVTLSQ